MVRWPLQPLQSLQKTHLQPPLLCHLWFTTTNLSYSFLCLKLPPPPCAVLLVVYRSSSQTVHCRRNMYTHVLWVAIVQIHNNIEQVELQNSGHPPNISKPTFLWSYLFSVAPPFNPSISLESVFCVAIGVRGEEFWSWARFLKALSPTSVIKCWNPQALVIPGKHGLLGHPSDPSAQLRRPNGENQRVTAREIWMLPAMMAVRYVGILKVGHLNPVCGGDHVDPHLNNKVWSAQKWITKGF